MNNEPFTYNEFEFKNNLEFIETSLFDIKPPEAVIVSENKYPLVESVLTMINSLQVIIFAYKLPFIEASEPTNKRLFKETSLLITNLEFIETSPVKLLLPPVNRDPFTYIEFEFKNNREFNETSPPTNKRLLKETSLLTVKRLFIETSPPINNRLLNDTSFNTYKLPLTEISSATINV